MEIRRDYEPQPGWTISEWEEFLKKARAVGASDTDTVGVIFNDTEPYVSIWFEE